MGVGSCLHVRDSAGGQVPTTLFGAFEWDTTITSEDGTYTMVDVHTVQFNEAGYFVGFWTQKYANSTNFRSNVESMAYVASGSGDLYTSQKAGYVRNSANNLMVSKGKFFYHAAAGDQLQIRARRDSDVLTGGSVANGSSLTITRIWDSPTYGLYFDTADINNRLQGTTPNDVTWATIVRETDTSSIQRQAGNADFQIKKPNTRYWIWYDLGANQYTGSGFRTQRVSHLVAGATLIPGSQSYGFQRDQNNEYAGLGSMVLYRTAASPVNISAQVWQGDGTNNFEGGCSIPAAWARNEGTGGMLIIEVPTWVNCFAAHDGTGGLDITGGDVAVNACRDVDFADSAAFAKTQIYEVTAQKTMTAVVFGNVRTARSNVLVTTRGLFRLLFKKASSFYQASEDIFYTRGLEATSGSCFGGGGNASMVFCGANQWSIGQGMVMRVLVGGESGGGDTIGANWAALFALDASSFPEPNPAPKWFVDRESSMEQARETSMGMSRARERDMPLEVVRENELTMTLLRETEMPMEKVRETEMET